MKMGMSVLWVRLGTCWLVCELLAASALCIWTLAVHLLSDGDAGVIHVWCWVIRTVNRPGSSMPPERSVRRFADRGQSVSHCDSHAAGLQGVGRVCYTRGYFQGRSSPHSPLVGLFKPHSISNK
jgi:hypothetical protein